MMSVIFKEQIEKIVLKLQEKEDRNNEWKIKFSKIEGNYLKAKKKLSEEKESIVILQLKLGEIQNLNVVQERKLAKLRSKNSKRG